MEPLTAISDFVDPQAFMTQAMRATTSLDIEALLEQLPICSDEDYTYSEDAPQEGWQPNKFHWLPVGLDRGNAGRIKQANNPINPIAERTVNGMEALIEMARQLELLADPSSNAPSNPREAVARYFDLPPLDQLPKLPNDAPESKQVRAKARDLARQLRIRLMFDKATKQFAVGVEDEGIGQAPNRIHQTLLSLGSTTKADKWYLIGVFGQGGSSAYAVSEYSWVLSRRHPTLLNGDADGVGWTIIRHIYPKNRRDDYFAYLAASPDGRVPAISAGDADAVKVHNGTRFVHIGYDFGKGGSAITRQLYPAINHVLYNPILPFELLVGSTLAPIYGNGYRLSSLGAMKNTERPALDKLFPSQPVI